jgi:hypothetical protein
MKNAIVCVGGEFVPYSKIVYSQPHYTPDDGRIKYVFFDVLGKPHYCGYDEHMKYESWLSKNC